MWIKLRVGLGIDALICGAISLGIATRRPYVGFMSGMRAVVVTAHGGSEVLEVQDLPIPEPSPTQLLVSVAAAGVNFVDVYRREGVYPMPAPFRQGTELAGTVLAVGSAVTEFEVGDRIATAACEFGSQATHALVEEVRAVPVPSDVDLQIAAAAMLQGMTAHYLVTSAFQIRPDHQVLIHAAAGGTGGLAVQLARAAGAHVVATVGSEAKTAIAREHGAQVVLRYDEVPAGPALTAAIRDASDGGVHVAYDGVGKDTFDTSLGSLRRRGTLVLFGGASGQVPPFDLQRLNGAGSLFVTRPKLDDYTAERAELLWRAAEMFAAIGAGTMRVTVGGRYALEDTPQAYDDLVARRTMGKLVIVP
jgi:NADPH2:quinone reductase